MSSDPFSSITVDAFIDIDTFIKEINEDITDINEAARTITARSAHYAVQASKARKQAGKMDNLVKVLEATLKNSYRKKLTQAAIELAQEEGGKPERVTADMVQSAVLMDKTMLRALNLQLETDEVRSVCNVAVDAFRTRREMIKSLGHLTTEEIRSNVRIHGRQSSDDVNRAGTDARSSKSATELFNERRARRLAKAEQEEAETE